MSESGLPLQDPIFSPEVHEIGTRLVDMLNQVAFLHRFPALAGVTLACIAQHIVPMRRLLGVCESQRRALSREKWPDGCRAGSIVRDEILAASYDYALTGYRTFVEGLVETASFGEASADELASLERLRSEGGAISAQAILEMKELVERFGEGAIAHAQSTFEPMQDVEWQRLRVDIFCYLFELDAVFRRDAEGTRLGS